MRAGRIVEAFGADKQIVQNPIVQDRFFDDPRNIFNFDVPVEDALRINHDVRPVLALIETTSGVGTNEWTEAPFLDLRLEGVAQSFRALWIATAARMARSTLIATDEKMMRERGHKWMFFSLSLWERVGVRDSTGV
jgi:hypothetical protein